MTHIIRQQYLHVALDGAAQDGFSLQQRLPDVCRHHLLPAIERILNRFAPDTGHWLIERLEIDLGELAFDCAGESWEVALEQTLGQALREQLPPSGNRLQTITQTNANKSRYQSEQESLHGAFLHFLATGALPWSFHLPPGETLESQLLAVWRTDANTLSQPSGKRAFMTLLAASATVRQRLARQFSPLLLQRLLGQLAPGYLEIISHILRALSAMAIPSPEFQPFNLALWETVFLHLSQQQEPDETSLLEEALGHILASASSPDFCASALFRSVRRHWPALTASGTPPDMPPSSLRTRPPLSPHPNLPPQGGKEQEVLPSSVLLPSPLAGEGPGMGGSSEDGITGIAELPSQDTLYTNQAGLVLLHPFLPRFFEVLGITDGEKLLQPERAPGLLYFLATGQPLAPEYELTLPKILCNLPLNTPLPADIGITPQEQDEAITLLEAVIRHWPALRNTSPDGLRGNFLNRLGKLSPYPDGGWLLQVENQTHDLLLDQLPWSIAMLKLPWMPHLLRVEWHL
jgi:hypothetical protein